MQNSLGLCEFILGLIVTLTVTYDVFQAVVVPRWTARTLRLGPFIIDMFWPIWRRIGLRCKTGTKREDFLGTFAPLVLMLLLLAWGILLIAGYGLMLHALRGQTNHPDMDLVAAGYLASVSLLTLGFGDIVAIETPARIVLTAAAASGLSLVALVISLTFTLYSSFQRREIRVLMLEARAGAPPSGVTLLETYAKYDMMDGLPTFFRNSESWAAEMLESHLAYPILFYFRSSHDNQSWVSALGAVLDAATLVMTNIDSTSGKGQGSAVRPQGSARMMYELGCHVTFDLSHWFRFCASASDLGCSKTMPDPMVERSEFDLARQRLEKAGHRLLPAEEAWVAFRESRAVYAAALNQIAEHLATPPSQWIGDRVSVAHLRYWKSEPTA